MERDNYLKALGLNIFKIPDIEIKRNLSWEMDCLWDFIISEYGKTSWIIKGTIIISPFPSAVGGIIVGRVQYHLPTAATFSSKSKRNKGVAHRIRLHKSILSSNNLYFRKWKLRYPFRLFDPCWYYFFRHQKWKNDNLKCTQSEKWMTVLGSSILSTYLTKRNSSLYWHWNSNYSPMHKIAPRRV